MPLLPTNLAELQGEHILALLENETPERKVLDYKQQLPSSNDDDRKEFLADVSSFANASGGDLIFGIAERRSESNQPTGLPEKICDLNLSNPASDCAKLENILRDGIKPRIRGLHIQPVTVNGHGTLIVIRIPRSWVGPHMITFKNSSRFYSRNSSTGKYQLDVQEIGQAFTTQNTLGEQLRNWRTDRIGKVLAGEGPVPLEGPTMLLHFVPAVALQSDLTSVNWRIDVPDRTRLFQPLSYSTSASRYNADGYLVSGGSTHDKSQSYLQVFRTGALEYGDNYSMQGSMQGAEQYIPSGTLEAKIVAGFSQALAINAALNILEPIFFSASLLRAKTLKMALPMHLRFYSREHPIDRDVVMSPDVLIEGTEEGLPYPTSILPVVNSIWQASGHEQTPNIGADGKWNVR